MNRAPIEIMLHHIRAIVDADTGPSDAQLLERFAVRGEEEAFSLLLERHGRLVWSVCRRILRHSHDAEDAFQAAFLVLARQAVTIRKQSSISSWLYGVASHLSWQLRKRLADRATELLVDLYASGQPEPHTDISLREALTILDEEVARLPEKYRGPIVLCHLQGKTTEEAAQELGSAVGTLRTRLLRARELLQARLRTRGIAAPAVVITILAAAEVGAAAIPQTLAPRTLDAVLSFFGWRCSALPVKTLQLANGFLMSQMIRRLTCWALSLAAMVLLGGGATAFLATGLDDSSRAESDPPQAVEKAEPGAVARPGTIRVRHSGGVSSISISPNGKLLATTGEDGQVRLWEVSTGREVAVLGKKNTSLRCAVFSPNSKTVAVVDEQDEISLWDVASGKEKRRWKTPEHHLVAFAPDGKTLASGGVDKFVCFWDPSTGKLVRQIKLRGHVFRAHLQFSADGKFIAGSNCGSVLVLETATGNEWLAFDVESQGPAYALAFAPDGKMLASCERGRWVRVFGMVPDRSKKVPAAGGWQLPFPTAKKLHELESPGRRFLEVAFSPDGRLLAIGGYDGMVHLRDTATWRQRGVLRGHKGYVTALAFLSNDRLVWASADETELVWNIEVAP